MLGSVNLNVAGRIGRHVGESTSDSEELKTARKIAATMLVSAVFGTRNTQELKANHKELQSNRQQFGEYCNLYCRMDRELLKAYYKHL